MLNTVFEKHLIIDHIYSCIKLKYYQNLENKFVFILLPRIMTPAGKVAKQCKSFDF